MRNYAPSECTINPAPMGGVSMIFSFDNRYRLSVVLHNFSYGGKSGLFEVACLDPDSHFVPLSGVHGDVEGYCTMQDVLARCAEVESLPAKSSVGE